MMTPHEKKSVPYEVGNGKPRMQTRFRKGQSGNPGGRPRRTASERANTLTLREMPRHGRSVRWSSKHSLEEVFARHECRSRERPLGRNPRSVQSSLFLTEPEIARNSLISHRGK